MLHYVRTDVSEGNYFNKVNDSCACKICITLSFLKWILNLNDVYMMTGMIICKELRVLMKLLLFLSEKKILDSMFWLLE